MDCDIYSNGSNLTVQHTMNTLPVGFCPSTWQDVFNQVALSIIGTLQGTFGSFTIGSNTPDPDDQDKLWLRLDPTTCAPLGWFIYSGGTWKRAIPHPMQPGNIIYHYDAAWALKTDAEIRTLVEALDNYDSGTPFGICAMVSMARPTCGADSLSGPEMARGRERHHSARD